VRLEIEGISGMEDMPEMTSVCRFSQSAYKGEAAAELEVVERYEGVKNKIIAGMLASGMEEVDGVSMDC
jgi:hypothetical protein